MRTELAGISQHLGVEVLEDRKGDWSKQLEGVHEYGISFLSLMRTLIGIAL